MVSVDLVAMSLACSVYSVITYSLLIKRYARIHTNGNIMESRAAMN